jgi:hypothetical protein
MVAASNCACCPSGAGTLKNIIAKLNRGHRRFGCRKQSCDCRGCCSDCELTHDASSIVLPNYKQKLWPIVVDARTAA